MSVLVYHVSIIVCISYPQHVGDRLDVRQDRCTERRMESNDRTRKVSYLLYTGGTEDNKTIPNIIDISSESELLQCGHYKEIKQTDTWSGRASKQAGCSVRVEVVRAAGTGTARAWRRCCCWCSSSARGPRRRPTSRRRCPDGRAAAAARTCSCCGCGPARARCRAASSRAAWRTEGWTGWAQRSSGGAGAASAVRQTSVNPPRLARALEAEAQKAAAG